MKDAVFAQFEREIISERTRDNGRESVVYRATCPRLLRAVANASAPRSVIV
jgi:hypothetical protein